MIPTKDSLKIGVVEAIESNKVSIQTARKKTGSVAIRIKSGAKLQHGRHFEMEDEILSMLTRKGIDKLKEHYRDEMTKDDWNLVRKLKVTFQID